MKIRTLFYISIIVLFTSLPIVIESCRSSRTAMDYQIDTLKTNSDGYGNFIEIIFNKGSEHNHPLMAVWIEDTNGKYIQTLYIAKSIAKAEFEYANNSEGKWQSGSIRRPAALPVWSHSRGIVEDDGMYIPKIETAIPDAYTGPTPPSNFVLLSRTDTPLPSQFYLLFEINQTWDWNEYWTNSKYPDDVEYKTSSQPALVYRILLDKNIKHSQPLPLDLIGHSHYSGKDGLIVEDLSTITTAKEITESVFVRIIE